MMGERRPSDFLPVISFLPDRGFRGSVARYNGEARQRGFPCWEQYLAMAQLTYCESLRDIEACLRVNERQAVPHGLSQPRGAL
jgi:hypothetical protein